MIKAAGKYHLSGLSVIPVGEDKRPRTSPDAQPYVWKEHQHVLIPPMPSIFGKAWGIGIVCGAVSGNLECIDVDSKYDLTGKLMENFVALIRDNSPGTYEKLVVEGSPSGGWHLVYRAPVDIAGNKKLASRPTTDEERAANPKDKRRVLIETRGEGGYFACAPTPGYKLRRGDFENVPIITAEEREIILACARSFNEVYDQAPEKKPVTTQTHGSGLSPFEDYNQNGDPHELLEAEGWTLKRQIAGKKFYYLRPGGEQNWSAEWDSDKRLFYVWTSSTEFVPEKAYNLAQVASILKFHGDYSEAAKWMLKMGFGESNRKNEEGPAGKSPRKAGVSPSVITEDQEDFSFVADEAEMTDYETRWREGKFEMGKTTGLPGLDKFLRHKPGNFNIWNGLDNVGKSTVLWYLFLLGSLFHGFKWIILSMENRNGAVRKKLIEFYWGITIDKMTDDQYATAKKFVMEHFTIIKNNAIYNYKDVIAIAKKCNTKRKHNGMLVDPYNGLTISLSENSKLSTHEYHYEAASELQVFTKTEDMMIHLNCHVITSALRDPNTPPKKGDTEGGAKFANKADDFCTIHRLPQDPTEWTKTQIHVRKIKELETGGGYTPYDRPFILQMQPGGVSFKDWENNVNPVAFWHEGRKPVQATMEMAAQENVFMSDGKEQYDDQPF